MQAASEKKTQDWQCVLICWGDIAIMNDIPIPMPKTAMDRVRTSLRVASVMRAVKVADMAPAPCSKRPAIIP